MKESEVDMKDISLKIGRENIVWKWLESQDDSLITSGHIGTHIDVYNKSEVPENYFESDGVIVDCRSYHINQEIGMDSIQNLKIEQGTFVIFRTDMMKKYPYGSEKYINNHYQLSMELIDYLSSKKINFIGVDFAGIRRGKEHFEADIKCENREVYVIENLDLTRVEEFLKSIKVYTAWINNPLATGLSTKVFIEEKE